MITLASAISFAKKRFERNFVYLLPLFMAMWLLFGLFYAIDNFTVIKNEQGRAAVVEIWVYALCSCNMFACMFITPSLKFLLLGYGPALVLALIYLIASYGMLDSYANLAVIAIIFQVLNIVIFYALQHRELMRFLELKHSKQKSEQLLAILNAQNNSILVVRSEDELIEAPKDEKGDSPHILFCNDRCT